MAAAEATPASRTPPTTCGGPLPQSVASVLVAEVEGQAVGSIIGTFDGWRGNLYRLAVHPDCRRRGVAQAGSRSREEAGPAGGERITALVEKDHPWATSFWGRWGTGRSSRSPGMS